MKKVLSTIYYIPYVNRDPIWIKPTLVVEVKFSGWTKDKIMRSPIFLRFREDKRPEECIIEEEKKVEEIVQQQEQQEPRPSASSPAAGLQQLATNNTTSTSSSAASTAYFSNLDKVFWNKTELGRLDKVAAWLQVRVMVNTVEGFTETADAANGFSDLILALYGLQVGMHARSAIGVQALPVNLPVIVDAVVEVIA